MGKLSTATYKETLKQYAYGVAQDVKSALADFIAPRVPVGVGTGMFKKFSDKNAFQLYDTKRAVGGPATRMEFEATDGTFNCEANALEVPIDDQEREKAGGADQALEESRARTLVINASLAREKRVFDLVKANVAAAASKGAWSSSSSADPVDEIDEQIAAIANETGLMPNRMVIGLGAWRILKNHANVLKRQTGVSNKAVTLDVLAGMLGREQVERGGERDLPLPRQRQPHAVRPRLREDVLDRRELRGGRAHVPRGAQPLRHPRRGLVRGRAGGLHHLREAHHRLVRSRVMSWSKPTEDDFFATLEEDEANLFARNPSTDLAPVTLQIGLAVAHARGCVRSGRKCRMPSDEGLLPDMLVAPAMDYAAFNLLKRLRRAVNESRTKSYDRACSLFEKVAQGVIVPEDYGEDPADVAPAASLARPSIRPKRRLLGRRGEEGI